MRILFMADVPRDPNAGAAGTEVRTADALRALGHDVDEVWAPRLGRRIKHGNLHYLLELPRAYRREMRRAIAAKQYDVFHVNQPHGYLAAKWAHAVRPYRTGVTGRGKHRAPIFVHRSGVTGRGAQRAPIFVHRSHGLELRAERDLAPWRPRPRFLQRAMAALLARHSRLIARYADGHIMSCSDDARFLREELGVDDARIAVIAQAAPDAFVQSPAPAMSAERLRRVLYIGQFAFFKAPAIAAAAMRALSDGLRFTWVCGRAHHAEVRALLGDVPVELLDWMPADALRDVYDAHGIFLFTSFYEGFGKVFLEAMSRGLCVVATRVGGAPDIIADQENGLLVAPGDAGAIATAAKSLLDDPERAARIGASAARTARAYTWERVARETAAFYERLSSLQ